MANKYMLTASAFPGAENGVVHFKNPAGSGRKQHIYGFVIDNDEAQGGITHSIIWGKRNTNLAGAYSTPACKVDRRITADTALTQFGDSTFDVSAIGTYGVMANDLNECQQIEFPEGGHIVLHEGEGLTFYSSIALGVHFDVTLLLEDFEEDD